MTGGADMFIVVLAGLFLLFLASAIVAAGYYVTTQTTEEEHVKTVETVETTPVQTTSISTPTITIPNAAPKPTAVTFPTIAPRNGWTFCGGQGSTCNLSAAGTVLYGGPDNYLTTSVPAGQTTCDATSLGFTASQTNGLSAFCYSRPGPMSDSINTDGTWTQCSNDGGTCTIPATGTHLRYGIGPLYWQNAVPGGSTEACTDVQSENQDAAYGFHKYCYYK